MQFKVPHYKQEFFLEDNQGNNGFDYHLRAQSNPQPHLRVAPLVEFSEPNAALSKLSFSNTPAFELEVDKKIKSFAGLDNFAIFPNSSNSRQPVIIIDNHNHAFYFWHWGKQTLHFTSPTTLIHIDQHKDTRIPAEMLSPEEALSLDNVFQYTNQTLNVGNFIPAAIKTGLIGEVINIDSSTSLDKFKKPATPFILDIDMDFFAPELDYIDNQKKISLIQILLPSAKIVTIATSPFFIKQTLVPEILKEIFQVN